MKGKNSIELNQATLIEAIQEYLDKRWVRADQEVVSVRAATGADASNLTVVALITERKEPT